MFRHTVSAALALIGACAHEAVPDQPWIGCYALTWLGSEDSARIPGTTKLPDSIRLVAVRDPQASGGESLMVQKIAPSSRDWWPALRGAWWKPFGKDSMHLTLVTFDQQWSITFTPKAESLYGIGELLLGDHDLETVEVKGESIVCPSR